jgi:hypothetical protein
VAIGHPDASALSPTLDRTEESDPPGVVEEHDDIGSLREEINGGSDASFRNPSCAADAVSDESA